MKQFLRRLKAPVEDPDNSPEHRIQRKSFPSGIKLLYGPDDATVDIIFIHGLTGDRDATWTARDATKPWPQTLLSPILPTARILTFGYDAFVADWRGVVLQNRIANHAWNLLTSLSSYRGDGTNERPIIFICHNLGGLVCEDVWPCSQRDNDRSNTFLVSFIEHAVSSFSAHRTMDLVLQGGLGPWPKVNLAITYHAQGRYEDAELIHIKALELGQKVLSQEHPDTIWNMARLATTYHAQGRYDEAQLIHFKVLKLRQKVLGQEHPETIWSVAQTRSKYPGAQNRDEEAESV
ncbi:hypothetical protein N7507_004113 [Penicillium longicatenatum]|nr:hypothetical protein N7507_004113 [Penicillium longicatenatum]